MKINRVPTAVITTRVLPHDSRPSLICTMLLTMDSTRKKLPTAVNTTDEIITGRTYGDSLFATATFSRLFQCLVASSVVGSSIEIDIPFAPKNRLLHFLLLGLPSSTTPAALQIAVGVRRQAISLRLSSQSRRPQASRLLRSGLIGSRTQETKPGIGIS